MVPPLAPSFTRCPTARGAASRRAKPGSGQGDLPGRAPIADRTQCRLRHGGTRAAWQVPLRWRDVRGDGAVQPGLVLSLHDVQGDLRRCGLGDRSRPDKRHPRAHRARADYPRTSLTRARPRASASACRANLFGKGLARLRSNRRTSADARRAIRGQARHAHLRPLGRTLGNASQTTGCPATTRARGNRCSDNQLVQSNGPVEVIQLTRAEVSDHICVAGRWIENAFGRSREEDLSRRTQPPQTRNGREAG